MTCIKYGRLTCTRGRTNRSVNALTGSEEKDQADVEVKEHWLNEDAVAHNHTTIDGWKKARRATGRNIGDVLPEKLQQTKHRKRCEQNILDDDSQKSKRRWRIPMHRKVLFTAGMVSLG